MKKGENDERQKEKGGCQKMKIQAFGSSLIVYPSIRLIWMKPEPDLNELSWPSHEPIRGGGHVIPVLPYLIPRPQQRCGTSSVHQKVSSPPLRGLQMVRAAANYFPTGAKCWSMQHGGEMGRGGWGGGGVHRGGERPVPSLFCDAPDLDLPGSGAKLKQLASHWSQGWRGPYITLHPERKDGGRGEGG